MPSSIIGVRLPDLYLEMVTKIREANDFISDQEAIRHAIRETCLDLPRETLAAKPKNKSKKSAKTPLTS